MNVAEWLRKLGLEQYEPAFRENKIGPDLLPSLTAEDLKDLGVGAVGDRRRLLGAIAALQPIPAVEPAAPQSGPTVKTEAERRQLTVMFCDLVGSTALSARLDPEDLRAVIGKYHRCCAEAIGAAGGFVAKYMGDGVLAYFGYPAAHEDDAERAVRAGLALVTAIGMRQGDQVPLQVRVGIATGLVVVGDLIGEGAAQEQSVVGETPNLAARLQSLAEPGTVVIAASTRRLLGGLFDYRDLGGVQIKGFTEPVPAFRVLGASAEESRFEARQEGGPTPLVGREEELDLLLRRWRQAKAGESRVVLLTGDPGIGKSRVVRALQDQLANEPYTRLRYFCSPHHRDSALHPVVAQVEHAARFTRDDAPEQRLAKLEALLARSNATEDEIALIAELLSLPRGERYRLPEMSPQRRKERTLEALFAQTERLARQQPVLMVFEDLHWIDPTSLELLILAIERWQRLPVLLVVTARPEFTPPWPGHAHATAIALTRLDRHEGAALVERVAGGKALPAEVLEQILARTDGVPLFVEELTKTVLESGLLREEAGRYVLGAPLPPLAIPATLHDSLMARLDRLAPVREIAQIGAALGREFTYELLRAVAAISEDRLQAGLRDLVRSELVFCRGVPPEAVYTFKHALVQDAAYQTMLRSRRAQLHAHIADVMERSFPAVAELEPETLARHFAAAALAERAIPYWLAAGQRALQRSAMKEAIGHLNAGIGLLADVRDEAARVHFEIGLQIALAHAWTAIKGYTAPEVEAAFSRAQVLCLKLGQSSQTVPILVGLSAFHWVRGNLPAAIRSNLQLVEIADRTSDGELSLVAHAMLGGLLHHVGDISESETHLKIARNLYEPQKHRNIFVKFGEDKATVAWEYHALNMAWRGNLDAASSAAQEAVRLARQTGHPYSLAHALVYAATGSVILRDPINASSPAEQAVAIGKEHGFPLLLAMAEKVLGWKSARQGKAREGADNIKNSIALWRSTGANIGLPYYFALLSEAELLADDTSAAIVAADEGLQWATTNSEHSWDCMLHCAHGDAVLASGDRAQAEADYQRALAWSRERSAKWGKLNAAMRLARLWCADSRAGQARHLLAPVYGWFTEGLNNAVLKEAKALLDELAAEEHGNGATNLALRQ